MRAGRWIGLLKAYGWVLNLLFIGLGSHFVAKAANAWVAQEITRVPAVEDFAAKKSGKPKKRSKAKPRQFALIAERNLFAAKREDLNPPEPTAEVKKAETAKDVFDDSELKPCSISSVLRATLVADDAPEWSLAVLYNSSKRQNEVYSINEDNNEIAADATLVAIRSRSIVVRRRDHYERCVGEGEGGKASSKKNRRKARNSGKASKGNESGGGEGVTKLSPTEYRIERGEIDETLANLNKVATQARIVPSFKNGKSNGFKLFSIKPKSIFSKIGMQNGDVIQKINGYDINSPEKALEVYQKLQSSSSISIDFLRRGAARSHNYAID